MKNSIFMALLCALVGGTSVQATGAATNTPQTPKCQALQKIKAIDDQYRCLGNFDEYRYKNDNAELLWGKILEEMDKKTNCHGKITYSNKDPNKKKGILKLGNITIEKTLDAKVNPEEFRKMRDSAKGDFNWKTYDPAEDEDIFEKWRSYGTAWDTVRREHNPCNITFANPKETTKVN